MGTPPPPSHSPLHSLIILILIISTTEEGLRRELSGPGPAPRLAQKLRFKLKPGQNNVTHYYDYDYNVQYLIQIL